MEGPAGKLRGPLTAESKLNWLITDCHRTHLTGPDWKTCPFLPCYQLSMIEGRGRLPDRDVESYGDHC